MCGIVSYYNSKGLDKSIISTVLISLDALNHRGPDGDGVILINTRKGEAKLLQTDNTPSTIRTALALNEYIDFSADLILAHRRLSIIDLSSNGFQPMHDSFGNYIVFNGEVYNYIELKEELMQLGVTFSTTSDTEVVLAAYRIWGENCLQKFNGMWSILIWDNINKQLFVSNDRFGIKSLYCYQSAEELIYASEVKAFYAFTNATKEFNHEAINLFLETGKLDITNQTFFKLINRFPKSHFRKIKFLVSIDSITTSYWKATSVVNNTITEADAIEKFNYLLKDSIKLRLRADVECGIALSGGLDSSIVCYYAQDILKNQLNQSTLKSFSIVFPNKEGDESYFSKYVVNDLGLKGYYTNPLDTFSFKDLEQLTYHLDFPLQSTSFYAEWSLMKLVSDNNIKVLLGGQGADELFAGYHHHFYKYCRQLLTQGRVQQYLSQVTCFSNNKNLLPLHIHKIVINDIKLLWKLKLGMPGADKNKEYKKVEEWLINDFSIDMLPTYLRCDDRSSMAHGIETRLPFLDYRMVEFGMQLPVKYKIENGWQKSIIRKSGTILPAEIRYRKDKKGFTTPQAEWMDKYSQNFLAYLPYLKSLGIDISDNQLLTTAKKTKLFRYFSLGIWLKNLKDKQTKN